MPNILLQYLVTFSGAEVVVSNGCQCQYFMALLSNLQALKRQCCVIMGFYPFLLSRLLRNRVAVPLEDEDEFVLEQLGLSQLCVIVFGINNLLLPQFLRY